MVLSLKPSAYLTIENRHALHSAGCLILNELMDTTLNKIKVVISIKGATLAENVDGRCRCTEEYNDGKPREFEVDIRGDCGLPFAIKCMAHELVHVWQMCTGRIDKDIYHNTKDYYNSPWEVEARELEQPLYELYLNTIQ